jgi:preprotein translocase SecE subunit
VFFTDINAAFHCISWPKGKELVETSLVVLAFIVGLSVTVLVFDKVIEHALRLVLGA